jgi:putative spermidine/putrescine transport system permease protein
MTSRLRALDPLSFLALPGGVYLGLAFAVPLALLLLRSIQGADGFTLASYGRFLSDPYNLAVIGNTLKLALLTTAICLLVGYPAAFALAWSGGALQTFLLAALFLPLSVSVIVKAFGWTILLRSNGIVNQLLMAAHLTGEPVRLIFTQLGLLIGITNIFLPFMILPLFSVVKLIDARLDEAAATLGAGPLHRFLHVTLPLTLPGIVAGTALVFSLAVSAYVIPTLLIGDRYQVMSTIIAKSFLFNRNQQVGSTVGVLLLLIAVSVVVASSRLARDRRDRP